jgi:hypothetical protein
MHHCMCIFLILTAMKITTLLLSTALYISFPGKFQEISDWRGPDRNGIYPEKDLLRQWPEEGPETAWVFEGR